MFLVTKKSRANARDFLILGVQLLCSLFTLFCPAAFHRIGDSFAPFRAELALSLNGSGLRCGFCSDVLAAFRATAASLGYWRRATHEQNTGLLKP